MASVGTKMAPQKWCAWEPIWRAPIWRFVGVGHGQMGMAPKVGQGHGQDGAQMGRDPKC